MIILIPYSCEALAHIFKKNLAYSGRFTADSSQKGYEINSVREDDYESYFKTEDGVVSATITIDFDCITDYALEYIYKQSEEKPFFLTISHIEPHHQNDRKHYEGSNGSHFKTRNKEVDEEGFDDYKRSCHDGCLHVPLVIAGPGYRGGKRVSDLVSTVSLPKIFLAMAGIEVGNQMAGENLKDVVDGHTECRKNEVFVQISESRVGRAIRTEDYKYAVKAPGKHGANRHEFSIHRGRSITEEEMIWDITVMK